MRLIGSILIIVLGTPALALGLSIQELNEGVSRCYVERHNLALKKECDVLYKNWLQKSESVQKAFRKERQKKDEEFIKGLYFKLEKVSQ